MIDIPSGFITIPRSDGSYIPFFIKVRGEDIIWQNSSIRPIIENITEEYPNIENVNPAMYKFDVENSNNIIFDTNDNIYIEKQNEYNRYSITYAHKEEYVDINNDGIDESCLFPHGDSEITPKPNVYETKENIHNTTNIWHCRLSSDGFLSAYTYIPITNYVYQSSEDRYFAYSLFDYDRTVSFIDSWTLKNLKLPIPILDDTINIQIGKKSDISEFINSFIGSSYTTNQLELSNNSGESTIFNTISNIDIQINTINKISDLVPFLSTLKDCGLFVNITGRIPSI